MANVAVDNQLLNRTIQNRSASNLRIRQQRARQEQIESFEESSDNNNEELKSELADVAKDIVRGQSRMAAIKHGLKLGLILRQQASDLRFDGLGFWVVIILSGVKDIVDIASLSVSGWITTPFLTVPLFIVFFLRKSYFKRWFIKRYLWKYVLTAIFEMAPAASLFPAFTVSAILLKMSVDKKVRKLEGEAGSVNREVSKLKSIRV